MVAWKNPKASVFDEGSELPFYQQCTSHVPVSHSFGPLTRSPMPTPIATHSSLPAVTLGAPLLSEKKNIILSQEPRRFQSNECLDLGEEQPSTWKVVGAITFYLVAAIVMVFANKWVLRAVAVPITFLLCQLLLATGLLQLAGTFGLLEIPQLTSKMGTSLLPLILINVVGLLFNTFCLQYVDASFYQVARGLVLPFTVLASYLFLNSRPSPSILSTVLIVCVGFFWGVRADKLNTSWVGILLGVLSSITTSLHAIIVKRSLSITNSSIDLAYYINLFSSLLLIPLIPFTSEIGTVAGLIRTGGEPLQIFLTGALVTGIFGFLISLAGFLSIKVTSPVSHMVSSAVRGVLQTVLGMALFGDVITLDRLIGISIILGGSIAYTTIKDKGNQPRRPHARKNTGCGKSNPTHISPSKNIKHLTIKLAS